MREAAVTWTCSKRGTSHDSDVKIRACSRQQRSERCFAFLVLTGIAIAVLIISLIGNQLVYGDWTCAFAKCRKIVP
jgi:hypothetical protein